MIPSVVLERGERAFVAVLRRRYPDALFLVRDGAVGPEDADVSGEVAAGAAADVDAVEEADQDLALLGRGEAVPQLDERSADGESRGAG